MRLKTFAKRTNGLPAVVVVVESTLYRNTNAQVIKSSSDYNHKHHQVVAPNHSNHYHRHVTSAVRDTCTEDARALLTFASQYLARSDQRTTLSSAPDAMARDLPKRLGPSRCAVSHLRHVVSLLSEQAVSTSSVKERLWNLRCSPCPRDCKVKARTGPL